MQKKVIVHRISLPILRTLQKPPERGSGNAPRLYTFEPFGPSEDAQSYLKTR
jgi:hypothetical protein